MTCDQASELLSDYIDGEVEPGAAARLERHLASCDACAASLRSLRRTVRFVRRNAAVDPAAARAGANYADFTRSLVDPAAPRSTADVLLEWFAAGRREEEGAQS